jgi:hypothetical protein
VIEKHRIIVATIEPNPAKGAPITIHKTARTNKDKLDTKLKPTPKIEIQARGRVL